MTHSFNAQFTSDSFIQWPIHQWLIHSMTLIQQRKISMHCNISADICEEVATACTAAPLLTYMRKWLLQFFGSQLWICVQLASKLNFWCYACKSTKFPSSIIENKNDEEYLYDILEQLTGKQKYNKSATVIKYLRVTILRNLSWDW